MKILARLWKWLIGPSEALERQMIELERVVGEIRIASRGKSETLRDELDTIKADRP